MENKIAAPSLHPALWIAAISVTLASLTGIAALTGLLPGKSNPAPTAAISAAVPADIPPSPPAIVEVPKTSTTLQASPSTPVADAPPVVPHKAAPKKASSHSTQSSAAKYPPPMGAGVPPDYVPPPTVASAPPPCPNCGVITDIRQITHEGEGTGLGAVAGGVLGGALGNNVGNGKGRTLATIAGAIGGGLLGNKVEKSQRETFAYQISIRMEDGGSRVIETNSASPWRHGDHVRLVNGALVPR